jgi:malonyl-CoA/methylmalonyl-CoA synthetase
MSYHSLKDFFRSSFTAHSANNAITFLRNGEIETQLEYGQLDDYSSRMANYFLSMGVAQKDPVLLLLPKSVAFVVCHIALQKVGAISVPINPEFKKSELEYLIENTRPKAVVAGKKQIDILQSIDMHLPICEIDTEIPFQDLDFFRSYENQVPNISVLSNDPAIILYTSGTTGKPKGAILSQHNLIQDAKNIVKIWSITSSDSICHALPLFHMHGLSFAFHTLLSAGGHIVMMDRFDVENTIRILNYIEGNLYCTLFMAVPAMYIKLIENITNKNLDVRHIRLWASGSAPLLPKDFERIKQAFDKEPVEREGMTETGMNFSNPLIGKKKPGSIGFPLPGLNVKIVDPKTFQKATQGQPGEIWLKGPTITSGYWNNPKETEKAFVEGWFRTGDIGKVDQEGYYYLIDRLKDIIISGGENISPKEVEMVINRMDAVRESVVVGIHDEKWGEKVVAAVSIEPGFQLTAEEITGHCKSEIHSWKVPKEIRLIEKIPKNRMGKILRNEIKALFIR